MTTLLLLGMIAAVVAPMGFCGRGPRGGISWFVVLPHLTQPKKQRTRLQQKHRHGARRY